MKNNNLSGYFSTTIRVGWRMRWDRLWYGGVRRMDLSEEHEFVGGWCVSDLRPSDRNTPTRAWRP